jgi:hypothetical protein
MNEKLIELKKIDSEYHRLKAEARSRKERDWVGKWARDEKERIEASYDPCSHADYLSDRWREEKVEHTVEPWKKGDEAVVCGGSYEITVKGTEVEIVEVSGLYVRVKILTHPFERNEVGERYSIEAKCLEKLYDVKGGRAMAERTASVHDSLYRDFKKTKAPTETRRQRRRKLAKAIKTEA